jgi:hypothetical protein
MKNPIKNGTRNFMKGYWLGYYNCKNIPSLVILILSNKRMKEKRKWIIFKVLLSKIDWDYIINPDLKLYAKECGNQVLLARAFSHMARFDRGRAFQMFYNSKRRSFYCG